MKPVYIAVGGVTGAGKSTLVTRLSEKVSGFGKCMSIDERETHHPFLNRLFFDPERYSFQIQLNFMLQRVLLIKRWLDAGYNLVMERSHKEDRIFPEFLLDRDLITSGQYRSYMDVWFELDDVTPDPDVLVILDVSPEQAIDRIIRAEEEGHRPKEFPNESQRKEWVEGWCKRYQIFLEQVTNDDKHGNIVRVSASEEDPPSVAERVVRSLHQRGLF
ncbi:MULTISPECIES: deoxynucleoside kinase [unclassified Mameliella]|uniref:deoxynucleoside kinase n=1 Tax=unclassified Mameliella TaxID=2630630 RepID=UPI00273FA28B|nr:MULTISPECIES: deoxynucleoside kinase [unclassified Mameliella]